MHNYALIFHTQCFCAFYLTQFGQNQHGFFSFLAYSLCSLVNFQMKISFDIFFFFSIYGSCFWAYGLGLGGPTHVVELSPSGLMRVWLVRIFQMKKNAFLYL
jgi:hypothetical protein